MSCLRSSARIHGLAQLTLAGPASPADPALKQMITEINLLTQRPDPGAVALAVLCLRGRGVDMELTVTNTVSTHALSDIGVDEHAAPTALTVVQAHRLMQVHLECTAADCGARQTALTLLVAVRRYVLCRNERTALIQPPVRTPSPLAADWPSA